MCSHVILLGDLNYRISLPEETTRLLVENGDWDSLLEYDQVFTSKYINKKTHTYIKRDEKSIKEFLTQFVEQTVWVVRNSLVLSLIPTGKNKKDAKKS